MARLENKVAIITGATGGIGSAAARLFAREGACVVLVDLDEGLLKKEAQVVGNGAAYIAADVTKFEDNQRMARFALDKFGKIDIFLPNAGIEGVIRPIADFSVEAFDKVLAVNVRGVFMGLKAVAPKMQDGGSIVMTSSVAGLTGAAGMWGYITSKHAVIGLMRTAALEFAPRKIRVNTVNPGPIETGMMRRIEEDAAPGAADAVKKGYEAMNPLKRYGLPEEVANLMLFLASDESSYCNGNVFVVDGGMMVS